MKPLLACNIVQAWEWGRDKHPVDRALFLLGQAYPDMDNATLTALTLGQRNRRLIRLREMTFGSTLNGFARCEKCGEALEFSLATGDILLPEPEQEMFSLKDDDLTVTFRLPNSSDLAAIVGMKAADAARHLLIERCIMAAESKGMALSIQDLPASVLSTLAEAITEYDPQAEMRLALTCAACGYQWSALFDIVSYFWAELEARARRLLEEVHVLARAYGWREVEILQMSAPRRRLYLELAN